MLQFHANAGPTAGISGECTQLVVYNEKGDPVSVVVQLNDTLCVASHVGNEDFDNILKLFNIHNKNEQITKISKSTENSPSEESSSGSSSSQDSTNV